jgi:hypothetical protein
MFTLYTDKRAFVNFYIFPEKYPNWNRIIKHHSAVCIDLDEEVFDGINNSGHFREELSEENMILLNAIQNATTPTPLSILFSELYNDDHQFSNAQEYLPNNPRSVFILDISEEKAKTLQDKFGVLVLSLNNIDDNLLSGFFEDEFDDGQEFDNGWSDIFQNFEVSPSNSMVISDRYLFSDVVAGFNLGEENIIRLIDEILPYNIAIDYHITLMISRNPVGNNPIAPEQFSLISKRLIKKIEALRSYLIKVEVIENKTIHKRVILTNYSNYQCDVGFKVFGPKGFNQVRGDDHDFKFQKAFDVFPENGVTPFRKAEKTLIKLKEKYLKSLKTESYYPLVFRNFNEPDGHKPLNRLLLDV